MLARFGVIGDIHAEDDALASAIAVLEREKVDRILAVGDLVDGRGDVNRVVRLLREHDVPTVRGNHERWFLGGGFDELPMATRREELDDAGETWAFLAALPATRRFDTVAGSLLLCHGVGDDDMALLRDFDDGYALESNDALQRLLSSADAPAFVACGHTHRRMVRRLGRTTFLNAGTLLRSDGPGFLLVDLAAREARFFDVDGTNVQTSDVHRLP